MRSRATRLLLAICSASGCGTASLPPQQRSSPVPSNVDTVFQKYRQKLPAPATLSEANGATLECDHHGYATYTLLHACAEKVPISSDRDLVALVPWLRDGERCIRQIAIDALLPKIGFDRNALSVPNMHDPEHVQYHDIFVALKTYLDGKKVAYDPIIFAGLLLTVDEKDFSSLMHGKWAQDTEGQKLSFEDSVEVDAEFVKVIQKEMHDDPKWPLHTWTTKIRDVRVTERGQFMVTGAWDVESNAAGYKGQKIEPSQFVYTFWPVKKGVVWLGKDRPGDWMKLRKSE